MKWYGTETGRHLCSFGVGHGHCSSIISRALGGALVSASVLQVVLFGNGIACIAPLAYMHSSAVCRSVLPSFVRKRTCLAIHTILLEAEIFCCLQNLAARRATAPAAWRKNSRKQNLRQTPGSPSIRMIQTGA